MFRVIRLGSGIIELKVWEQGREAAVEGDLKYYEVFLITGRRQVLFYCKSQGIEYDCKRNEYNRQSMYW